MVYSKLDPIEVWNDFREGDEKAFSILFEMYSDLLYRYGMKFVSDEELVKDCVQDLFIKIYNNRLSLSETDNPKFYMLRSIKNMIIDALSKSRRLIYAPTQDLPFIAQYEVEDGDEDDAIKSKFKQVIEVLNPRQKEAIYLRYQLELSYEEISEILEINYQSTRNLIHRAITKIRTEMDLSIFVLIFIKTFH